MKDENALLHLRHTFPSQKNKEFVLNPRRKHFHQYINPPPGEKSNDFLHLPFRCDRHGQDRFRGSATCLSPFLGSARCWYVYEAANPDFAEHKMYPAYPGRDDVPV